MSLSLRMVPSPTRKRLIGYARVSTEDQAHDAQVDELRAAGCIEIHQEHGSGASRARPVLARLIREIKPGEVLVVVRLDRLERSLISERTRAGIKAAKARGKKPGNPGMRERRPEAIRKITLAREKVYVDDLIAGADRWMPTVRRMRPQHPWEDVIRALAHNGQSWTVARLRRAVGKLVAQHMADPALLRPAPRKNPEDRLMALIAGIAMTDPSLSLRQIGAQLERMRERTPRGGLIWSASSVKKQLDRARKAGLALPVSLQDVV